MVEAVAVVSTVEEEAPKQAVAGKIKKGANGIKKTAAAGGKPAKKVQKSSASGGSEPGSPVKRKVTRKG